MSQGCRARCMPAVRAVRGGRDELMDDVLSMVRGRGGARSPGRPLAYSGGLVGTHSCDCCSANWLRIRGGVRHVAESNTEQPTPLAASNGSCLKGPAHKTLKRSKAGSACAPGAASGPALGPPALSALLSNTLACPPCKRLPWCVPDQTVPPAPLAGHGLRVCQFPDAHAAGHAHRPGKPGLPVLSWMHRSTAAGPRWTWAGECEACQCELARGSSAWPRHRAPLTLPVPRSEADQPFVHPERALAAEQAPVHLRTPQLRLQQAKRRCPPLLCDSYQ